MAETELAKQLRKYYKQAGNKIIFRNGLTLNQLSLLMWESLGFREIDSSVISRILRSERLFTYPQLIIFSRILTLSSGELDALKKAIAGDILKRYSFEIDLSGSSITKGDLKKIYEVILKLRENGLPQEAITLSSVIERFSNIDEKVLALIYNQKSRAIGEISAPGKVLSGMNALNDISIEIGEELRDPEILDMAYMNVGGAYYVARNWKESSDYLEANYKKVSTPSKIEFLRTLLLDYAYQNDFGSFKKALARAINYISDYNQDRNDVASLIEAMARALALFGFFKESRKVLGDVEKIELDPFYQSQILRCKVFIFSCEAIIGIKPDQDSLKEVINETQEDKLLPYKRHREQIRRMLDKIRFYEKG